MGNIIAICIFLILIGLICLKLRYPQKKMLSLVIVIYAFAAMLGMMGVVLIYTDKEAKDYIKRRIEFIAMYSSLQAKTMKRHRI